MGYNVAYEATALAFLVVLIFFYSIKRRFWEVSDQVFAIYMAVAFVDIILDIISVYTIAYADIVPLFVNQVINSVYLCMQSLVPLLLFFYIRTLLNYNWTIRTYLSLVPALVCAIVAVTTPITDALYYFENNTYMRGEYSALLFVNGAFYTILSLLITIWNQKGLGKKLFYTALSITAINVGGMIFHFLNPTELIIGTGIVLSLYIIYIALQNPDYYVDALTDTLNRNAFNRQLDDRQRKGTPYYLGIISLNNFKVTNEVFGVQNGDKILRMIGDYLQILTSNTEVYRIDGDIFAILLKNKQKRDEVCEEFAMRSQQSWRLQGNVDVTLSSSVYSLDSELYNHMKDDATKLIDYAMEEIIVSEPTKVYKIDEHTMKILSRKAQVESAISKAIDEHLFEVHYQPVYDANTRKVVSAEALVRMKVPGMDNVSPAEFIPIAEQNGTIVSIGRQVIEQVCRFVADNALLTMGVHSISINISPIQYMQDTFSEDLVLALQKYQIPKDYIVLELTETATALLEDKFLENMNHLREAGLRFSMDDYGTGYSTIQYLTVLPFNIIKLDKSIVWAASEEEKSRIVLSKTIDMLKALKLYIIAEGVETKEQEDMLREMGVDSIQGFYFSKPLPADDFLEFL